MKKVERIPNGNNDHIDWFTSEASIELFSENLWELDFKKDNSGCWISLTEIESGMEIFNYRCDTFISGRYLQRLTNSIEKFKNNKCTLFMSSWYPKLHVRFLLPLSEYPYMETTLYTKGNGEFISFKIYDHKKCTPIVFITTIKNIENFIKS